MATNITKEHRQPEIIYLQMDKNSTTYDVFFLPSNLLLNTQT